MTDIEDVKEEFNRLDSKDKRWIFVCLVVGASALISAALGGSLLGDLIAFRGDVCGRLVRPRSVERGARDSQGTEATRSDPCAPYAFPSQGGHRFDFEVVIARRSSLAGRVDREAHSAQYENLGLWAATAGTPLLPRDRFGETCA